MVAVRSDRIEVPAGLHQERVLAWMRSLADDALAGRTVWCAAALSGGHAAGLRLRELLHGDLNVRPLAVEAAEPRAALSRQLDAMLAGVPSPQPLGAAARAAYARGAELAGPSVGRVAPGDVVVLHDCFTVSLAAPLRERGAHAVWHLRMRSGSRVPCVRAAMAFLDQGGAAAVDAVVIDEWEGVDGKERVTALVPAAGLLDVRAISASGGDAARARRVGLAWTSLLGDIVEEDRTDHVGGTIRARPVIAAR